MTEPERDPFEERLRAGLRGSDADHHVDVDDFLSGVHHGARVRRARRVMAGAAAAVVVVAAGGFAVDASGIFDPTNVPVAKNPTTVDTNRSGRDIATAGPSSALKTARPLSLSATDSAHQFLLRAEPGPGCGSQGCAAVWATARAGTSWTRLGAGAGSLQIQAAATAEQADTVGQVRFAGNGSDGWVFGGALRSTHDGGTTWQQPRLPGSGQVSRLEAWGSFVYAVVNGPSGATVLSSPTARDSFRRVKIRPLVSVSSLVASQHQAALIAKTGVTAPNRLFLSSTGRAWNPDPNTCQPGWWPQALSTAGDALWMVCTDGRQSTAQVSTDQGRSWSTAKAVLMRGDVVGARDSTHAVTVGPGVSGIQLISTIRAPVKVADYPLGRADLVGFTNPAVGYVMDDAGNVIRSADGGNSWQLYNLPP